MGNVNAAGRLVRRAIALGHGTPSRGSHTPNYRLSKVAPRDTDPEIDDWLEAHRVARNTLADENGHLMVFLSGSYGNPQRQREILEAAVGLGYRAINLRYPNSWTVGGLSRRDDDPDVHEKVRMQIIDGESRVDAIRMHPANSIINRLVRLLQWLDEQYPEENWTDFLSGGQPNWASIVAAGHSQGGGHAALIGKLFELSRVVMLGAPADADTKGRRPAPWLSRLGATAGDRYFGFVHRRDQGYTRIAASWQMLGMDQCGAMTNIDDREPPFNQSHSLETDARPASRNRYHGSVAVDGATPRHVDGSPAFAPVWRYLFDLSNP